VILAVIVVFSLGPASAPGGFSFADKLWHALAYATLAGSLLRAAGPRRSLWIVAVWALAVGVALEFVQALDPFADRHPDAIDVLADALGVVAGLTAWQTLDHLAKRPPPRTREGDNEG
jgi:VanZ family protein